MDTDNNMNVFGIDGISNMMMDDVLDDNIKTSSMSHMLHPWWRELASHSASGLPQGFVANEERWLSTMENYMPIHKMLVMMKRFLATQTFKQMLRDLVKLDNRAKLALEQYEAYEQDKENLLLKCSQ
jgi:hypothetical protein